MLPHLKSAAACVLSRATCGSGNARWRRSHRPIEMVTLTKMMVPVLPLRTTMATTLAARSALAYAA